MMYDSLYRDNTTIKSLKFDESSESNSSSGGGVGHGVIHDRNQVTINDGNICVGAESYVDTSCMIQNSSYLHYKYLNKKWKIRRLMLIQCMVDKSLLQLTRRHAPHTFFLCQQLTQLTESNKDA